MVFQYKLALPENVLQTLLNDRLVAKGSVLSFVTTFFQVRGLWRLLTVVLVWWHAVVKLTHCGHATMPGSVGAEWQRLCVLRLLSGV